MRKIFDPQEFMELLTSKYGGKWDIWASYNKLVADYAKRMKLEALRPDQLPAVGAPMDEIRLNISKEKKVPFFPPIPFPGGLRFPHLHIEGKIYPLTQDQWKGFTKIMVDDLVGRLSKAQTINFEGLMEISESIGAFC